MQLLVLGRHFILVLSGPRLARGDGRVFGISGSTEDYGAMFAKGIYQWLDYQGVADYHLRKSIRGPLACRLQFGYIGKYNEQ